MKYIINLTIVFDPDSRLLMLRNNNQLTVGLSNPATRLLIELINNNRIELTRDRLIKHVWEDYGFSPSSATLSNHISELRKAFEALGVSRDILLTVPRIGFKMNAEIHPEIKTPKETAITEHHEPPPFDCKPVAEENAASLIDTDPIKKTRRPTIPVFSLTLVLILVAIAITVFVTMNNDDELALVGVEGKCKIYALDKSKQAIEQLKSARKMLAREKIDCSQIDLDIYYLETSHPTERFKVHFMATCTKNENMSYKNCNNYKLVE